MYTVKDISRMTGKTEEQVRRWIRSGKLKAGCLGGESGRGVAYMISEDDFNKFIEYRSYGEYKAPKPGYHQDIENDNLKIILEIARLQSVIDEAKQKQMELFSKLKD